MSEESRELTMSIATTVAQSAKSIIIKDRDTYKSAAAFLKEIKEAKDKITAFFKPMKVKADEAKRAILDEEKKALVRLLEADKYVRECMSAYEIEQERVRREEQALLDKIKREEEERIRKEADRKQEEEQINKAIALMEAGAKEEEIAKVVEELPLPISVPTVYIPPAVKSTPKVDGISYRTIWKFEVVDKSLLPQEYLTPNETLIGQVVRSTKGVVAIPGVRIWSDRSVSVS